MTWVLAILGGVLGAIVEDEEGLVLGALLGFLLGRDFELGRRLRALDSELKRLHRRFAAQRPPPNARPESSAPEAEEWPAPPSSPPVAADASSRVRAAAEPPTLEEYLTQGPAAERPGAHSKKRPRRPVAGPARPRPASPEAWDAATGGEPASARGGAWLDELAQRAKAYFIGGNPFVRIGVLILFFGVAFLLKYAAERSMVPVELRLGGVALGGIALLGFGWRQRLRRPNFGLVLQGGGIGVLYLTVFAAFSLYEFLPPEPAFLLLVVMTAASVVLAVRQDTLALAVLGVTGGFLAPVLVSSGSGDHVALFSYYALLNLGIFGVAWFRAWRFLNWLGFVFTYGIATAWGVLDYHPGKFDTTEPFLILFFLLYLGISVLFALRSPPRLKGYIDATLVFGNSLIAFSLQVALVHRFEYGIAFSALGMGAIYLVLGSLLWRRLGPELKALMEAFAALGIIFTSLAIPFAVDNQWSATAWALEGAGILWVGVRQSRPLARVFGILLQLGAGLLYLADPARSGEWLLFNSAFFSTAMVAVAGLFSAWRLNLAYREERRWENALSTLLLIWGLLWWLVGAAWQFDHFLPEPDSVHALALWSAFTCLGFALAYRRWTWRGAFWSAQLLLPLLALWAFILFANGDHPGESFGALAWPLAMGIFYLLLHRFERWQAASGVSPLLHVAGAVFLLLLLTWEGYSRLGDWLSGSIWADWRPVYLGLLPLLALALVQQGRFWPLSAHPGPYRLRVGGILAVYMMLWSLFANLTCNAAAPPLPYLPLLNPLDLVQIGALLLLARWWLPIAREREDGLQQKGWAIIGGLAFVFITAVLLRSLHHWAEIPYRAQPLFDSFLVQASLSVFWTLVAMGLMLAAARLGRRILWLTGSGLLALVVMKLFVVDLAAGGTLERIVSFVAVGLLLVAIGYFAPLPPRKPNQEEAQ